MAIKLKKTLYVGLGGTGVAILLKIKKCFIDIYDEIPPMIGFLAIDTDGAANSKSVTSNLGKQVRLDTNELLICTCTVPNALAVYRANPRVFDWIPSKNVSKLQAIAGNGAGQVRSNGRFIAYYNHEKIKGSIQSAVSKIHQLIPTGSKFKVDTTMNGAQCPTDINVIASVAGGTGGGMLVDVLSIIHDAFDDSYKIHPWIVLPDVFRDMNQGPAMENVYYNAYGVLRELDYIMHHNLNAPAIDFGHTKVREPLFNYAYIINNRNLAGVSFNTLDDLVDVIAKSAFLPANTMGAALNSPFDNIVTQQMGGVFDICDKKAWAASASSAELIYDGQAVGRARAYTIIRQLCDSMMQSPFDGSDDANAFVDNSDVLIRENNGRDDVIDALSSDWPPIFGLNIDGDTSDADIKAYIDNNCGNDVLEPPTRKALEKKLEKTDTFFEKRIADIMERHQGSVDAAAKFMQALTDIISICKKEMISEAEDYRKRINDIERTGWSGYLDAVRNKGIKGFFNPINEDAIEELQNKVRETVEYRREETRRSWAIRFYTSFEETIRQKQRKVEGLKANLVQIGNEYTNKLVTEQNEANSSSTFQIFLHTDDVMNASRLEIDDTIKTAFGKYLNGGVAPWIGWSIENIKKILWDFAKEEESVKKAVNQDINDIIRSIPEVKVKSYLDRLKTLASPLWTYDTQGFAAIAPRFDHLFIVGVGCDTSILNTDNRYKTYFDSNTNKASFAFTYQKDRVYVLVVEDLLPIYAVNNFSVYKRDTEIKEAKGFMMANYIDEKLNNRMNSENFNVMPATVTDDVLKYWVYGFVFGYIHYDYDGTDNQYWIRSKEHGNPLNDYRYNLSPQRDVAFNLFKSGEFYKEVEKGLDLQIRKNGNAPFNKKVDSIKRDKSYYVKGEKGYAQLSPLEASNIDEPNFKAVRDLLVQEIDLMSE